MNEDSDVNQRLASSYNQGKNRFAKARNPMTLTIDLPTELEQQGRR
jgi:hypothetical protein